MGGGGGLGGGVKVLLQLVALSPDATLNTEWVDGLYQFKPCETSPLILMQLQITIIC